MKNLILWLACHHTGTPQLSKGENQFLLVGLLFL